MRSQEEVMVKQESLFDLMSPKKHSIRYDSSDPKSCVSTIYIKRDILGEPVPDMIKATFEGMYKVTE